MEVAVSKILDAEGVLVACGEKVCALDGMSRYSEFRSGRNYKSDRIAFGNKIEN